MYNSIRNKNRVNNYSTHRLISNKLKFIMYADDTTIYFNLEDFDPYHLKRDINNELEKITLWAQNE